MGNKINFKILKKEAGQSTVEYILLLVVVLVFVNTVIRSDVFRQFFGQDSTFFQTIATGISRNYRYASIVTEDDVIGPDPVVGHPSFSTDGGSDSHFFVIATEYPE